MGIRFRKSKKIGPVRINLSKSGVGYSVGTKGYRKTRMANGRLRTTVSLPGTGLSHVSETSNKEEILKKVENAQDKPGSLMDKDAEIVIQIKNKSSFQIYGKFMGAFFLVLSMTIPSFILAALVCFAFGFSKKTEATDLSKIIYKEEKSFSKGLKKTRAQFRKNTGALDGETGIVWESEQDIDGVLIDPNHGRYSGPYKLSKDIILPEDVEVYRSKHREFIFFNNTLLVRDGKKIVVFDGDKITTKTEKVILIQTTPPQNKKHLLRTEWQHSNKNGDPDLRFKENLKIYVCEYVLNTLIINTKTKIKIVS